MRRSRPTPAPGRPASGAPNVSDSTSPGGRPNPSGHQAFFPAHVQPINEAYVLTSTRILARRRLITAGPQHITAAPRRRRRTRGFVQVASSVAAEKLRLNAFGHAYLGVGSVLIAVLFYLAIAAQITQASYDMTRLQDQQRQLLAEQDQLRYKEVTLHAPAQVQQQASQSGMQRVVPSTYVAGQPVAIDLATPVGASPSDTTPLWMRAIALVVNTVGGTRDVMAASNK